MNPTLSILSLLLIGTGSLAVSAFVIRVPNLKNCRYNRHCKYVNSLDGGSIFASSISFSISRTRQRPSHRNGTELRDSRICTRRSARSQPSSSCLFLSLKDDGEDSGIRVGIAGAGAVAFGTAAVLANAGHKPMLWSPTGNGTSELSSSNQRNTVTATGALEFEFCPDIATTPAELVNKNAVLMIALPANGHKRVFDQLAPFIRRDQHIIISSHASLGAMYLAQLLQESFDDESERPIPPITAWGTTICTARRPSGTHVRVNTVRQSVDLCTVPMGHSAQALNVCQKLFRNAEFVPRDGLLAVSLSNVNPQNHLGIALGNMGRIEKGEDWYQSLNITPNIGRFMEALDRERLAIAQALGDYNVKTIFQHFSWSFHVPMTDSISDMNQEIHEIGNDVYGPNTADSRYITEDVPFGLALIITLGDLVGRPAVLHMAGMDIMSAMYGRDFMTENDLLDALDLNNYTLEELKEAASASGCLRPRTSAEPTI